MNYKIITLTTLLLPLASNAIEERENTFSNNEKITLSSSNLKEFNFNQIESNIFVHEDENKRIEILTGTKGLNRYINDIENEISDYKFNEKRILEDDFKYENLLEKLNFYRLKLVKTKSSVKNNLNSNKTTTSSPDLCQIGFAQTYELGASSMFGRYFQVTSSYPNVAAPFPPSQTVLITASSGTTLVDSQGDTQNLHEQNTYIGTNNHQGSISAITSFNLRFISFEPLPTWNAVSTISKGNCFGYIIANGSW